MQLSNEDPQASMVGSNNCLRAVGHWEGNVTGENDMISASLSPLAAKITLSLMITGAEGGGFTDVTLSNVPRQMQYCTTTDNDGKQLTFTDGKYLRNLCDDSYCTERLARI